MKNEINRIAGRLVKAFNTNTVINPIPVKYCKNINLANKLRKLCEDQIKDETIGIKAGGTGIQALKKLKEKEPFTAKVFKLFKFNFLNFVFRPTTNFILNPKSPQISPK